MSKDFSRWEREFCRELGEKIKAKEWKPVEALNDLPPPEILYLANWFPSVRQSYGTRISSEWANSTLAEALTESIAAEPDYVA